MLDSGTGFLLRSGRARCGGCSVTEGPTHGGKRERKASGWRYDPLLGWLCRWCSNWWRWGGSPNSWRWSRRNWSDVDNSPRIVEKSAIVENSRRFGPTPILQRITVPDGAVVLSAAFMRSARRRELRKRRQREANNGLESVEYPSSQWTKWAKQKRAAARARKEGSERQP